MSNEAIDDSGNAVPALFQGYCSNIAISSTATSYAGYNGAGSTVGADTKTVTLCPDVDCYVLLSTSSAALTTGNGEFLPQFTKYTRAVSPGKTKLQVISKSSSTGLLNVVEDA